jgi:hypothetical protein
VDWVTASSLATAGGTLVLAVATFASVRAGNRAARLTERSLLASTRPLLMPSRLGDPDQKVGFMEGRWFHVAGGAAVAESSGDVVYLAISVRNAGNGIAVMHGWHLHTGRRSGDDPMPPLDSFTRLTRDLYVAAGDAGFWQGTFRDPTTDAFAAARAAVEARSPLTVDVLYGDEEGGQRVVTRFALAARDDGAWLATVSRHWHLDRPGPR